MMIDAARALVPQVITIAITLALLTTNTLAADADAQGNPAIQETKEQRDARMQWWREARFGRFIPCGIYSVPAGIYKGQKIQHIGEGIMNDGKIPLAQDRE